MNNVARKIIDISEHQMRHDEVYQTRIEKGKTKKQKRNAELRYLMKQKTIGALMIIATVLVVWLLLDGDATIGLVTVPLGLTLMFTKEKCWMDDYFYEIENEE